MFTKAQVIQFLKDEGVYDNLKQLPHGVIAKTEEHQYEVYDYLQSHCDTRNLTGDGAMGIIKAICKKFYETDSDVLTTPIGGMYLFLAVKGYKPEFTNDKKMDDLTVHQRALIMAQFTQVGAGRNSMWNVVSKELQKLDDNSDERVYYSTPASAFSGQSVVCIQAEVKQKMKGRSDNAEEILNHAHQLFSTVIFPRKDVAIVKSTQIAHRMGCQAGASNNIREMYVSKHSPYIINGDANNEDISNMTWVENGDRYYRGTLQSYNINPLHYFKFITHLKPESMKKYSPKQIPFYGVEIEMSNNEVDFASTTGFQKVMNSFGGDYGLLQHDGSIRGTYTAEMVTAPATYQVHMKRLKGLFDVVPKDKRTYNNSCGMHVHIGRNSLTGTMLGNIVKFLNDPENFKAISKLAGRGSVHYSNYSGTREFSTAFENGGQSGQRTSVINLTRPNTVELRLFASPTTYDEFKLRMQFVHALHKFSKSNNCNGLLFGDFYVWLTTHNKTIKLFPELITFIGKYCISKCSELGRTSTDSDILTAVKAGKVDTVKVTEEDETGFSSLQKARAEEKARAENTLEQLKKERETNIVSMRTTIDDQFERYSTAVEHRDASTASRALRDMKAVQRKYYNMTGRWHGVKYVSKLNENSLLPIHRESSYNFKETELLSEAAQAN